MLFFLDASSLLTLDILILHMYVPLFIDAQGLHAGDSAHILLLLGARENLLHRALHRIHHLCGRRHDLCRGNLLQLDRYSTYISITISCLLFRAFPSCL